MASILLSFIYICCVISWNGLLWAKTGSENAMLRDFQSLNNVVGELIKQNAVMMDTLDNQDRKLSRLEAENAHQDRKLSSLEAENAHQDRKLSSLEAENAHQDRKLLSLEAENERLKMTVANREDDVKAVSRNNRILMMNPETLCNCNTKPAFTARLSKHLTSIGNQQTVKFDTVESNVGNAYSPLSGVFTAPENGTYFFLASILSLSGQYLETEIVLNGKSVALMYCNNAHYDQGTNGVVVTLQHSDMVWVRHVGTEGNNVFGYNWSTFTGFQI